MWTWIFCAEIWPVFFSLEGSVHLSGKKLETSLISNQPWTRSLRILVKSQLKWIYFETFLYFIEECFFFTVFVQIWGFSVTHIHLLPKPPSSSGGLVSRQSWISSLLSKWVKRSRSMEVLLALVCLFSGFDMICKTTDLHTDCMRNVSVLYIHLCFYVRSSEVNKVCHKSPTPVWDEGSCPSARGSSPSSSLALVLSCFYINLFVK